MALLGYFPIPTFCSNCGRTPDNAVTESFFHSFKGECIDRESFQSCAQARNSTFDYIEAFYNRTRRHSTLQYLM